MGLNFFTNLAKEHTELRARSRLLEAIDAENLGAALAELGVCTSPNFKTQSGTTPLIEAVKHNMHPLMQAIEERYGEASRSYHTDLLLEAAFNGDEDIARAALPLSSPNELHHFNEDTALCRAARYGHVGVLRVLLEDARVDPNLPGVNQQTALMWAAHEGHEACLRLLLGAECDYRAVSPKGETALEIAVRRGHEGCVEILKNLDMSPVFLNAHLRARPKITFDGNTARVERHSRYALVR